MGRDDQLALLVTDIFLEQLQVVVGPYRAEVSIGFVEKVQHFVIMREEQQPQDREKLLLTLTELREAHSHTMPFSDNHTYLVNEVAEIQTLQIGKECLDAFERCSESSKL